MRFLFLSFFAALQLSGQTLINPSFENGSSGWTLGPGVEILGPVSGHPPMGVSGAQIASIGLSGASNSFLHQTLNLFPQTTYALSFWLGSSASQAGHEAKLRVRATNSTSGIFASGDFTVLTIGPATTNGYVRHVFNFTTPSAAGSSIPVTLFFQDASTNQNLVDPRLDNLGISQSSFPLLTNGGFENGLANWPVNTGVAVYGPPEFLQIGTEGSFAAALGADDASPSVLEYHMPADAGASYLLTFDMAAMGAAGFRAIVQVDIITQPGGNVFSARYTNTANGATPFGKPPFVTRTNNFTVPGDAASLIIRFTDQSPGGGFGVNPILDNVQLSLLSAPPGLHFYAGIQVKGIVGRAYALDYADEVAGGITNWIRMTNLTLTVSPTLIFDITSTNKPRRFYRTIAQ